MIIWTKIQYRIKWDSKGEGSEKIRNKIKEQIKILKDKIGFMKSVIMLYYILLRMIQLKIF